MIARTPSIIAIALATFAILGIAPNAQAQQLDAGGRLSVGRAGAIHTNDPADSLSLMHGTAFAGPTLRGALALRASITPQLRWGAELGFAWARTAGRVVAPDFERHLALTQTLIDATLVLDYRFLESDISPYASIGLGPRIALGASGTETRSGAVPSDTITPQIGGHVGIVGMLEAGVDIDLGAMSIPVGMRATYNFSYPGTTAERVDNADLATGVYAVDHDWSVSFIVGVDVPLGRRSITPPPLEPDLAPALSTLPDQDSDGFPDAEDSCPLEPGQVNGCPAGGGIIQVRCGGIELSDRIYFQTGSADIETRSFPMLDLVADTLAVSEQISQIDIEGHTDSAGSDSANTRLSQMRAEAVMEYLVDRGVAASRLTAVGHGESQPIASNDTDEGQAANRRVDFVIPATPGCYE